ncbi:MAG TPA: hypothetical protein VNO81_00225 [Candidatus Nitrosotenuis sp.]|jgi:hypothetical protein|nr:hypothetical protein [Candidatus Nitrosotenuis sp.]
MTIFTSLEAALRHGFQWMEYLPDLGMHLVVRSQLRKDGKRVRVLALARAG